MTPTIYSAALLGSEAMLVSISAESAAPPLSDRSSKVPLLKDVLAVARSALGRTAYARLSFEPMEPAIGSFGLTLGAALALAVGSKTVPDSALEGTVAWGDLSFDGYIRSARGVVAVARAARDAGLRRIIVSRDSAALARLVEGLEVVAAESVRDLVEALASGRSHGVDSGEARTSLEYDRAMDPDFIDVVGLGRERKAIEIMVAGRHHMLMMGPHGFGKSMLARRVQGVLPRLGREDTIEVIAAHDRARVDIGRGGLDQVRPLVRMPHHTVSTAGLLGSGAHPGEVTLAHHGVLFLDEPPEFARASVDGLLEPIRHRRVSAPYMGRTVQYPADFVLLASSKLCPCGFLGHPERVCVDSAGAVERYQSRIEPLADVFDLVCRLGEPQPEVKPESSEQIRSRITIARERQAVRYLGKPWRFNADVPLEDIEREIPTSAAWPLRLRRVARTIADLDAGRDPADPVTDEDMELAMQYTARTT